VLLNLKPVFSKGLKQGESPHRIFTIRYVAIKVGVESFSMNRPTLRMIQAVYGYLLLGQRYPIKVGNANHAISPVHDSPKVYTYAKDLVREIVVALKRQKQSAHFKASRPRVTAART